MKYDLLKQLCAVHAPSGDEELMTNYILNYVKKNAKNWKVKPKVFAGKGFQNNVILVFGKPRTAVFAHIDSIGFTARYNNGLVKVGGPRAEAGWHLVGEDSKGKIDGVLEIDGPEGQKTLKLKYKRVIDTGTFLTFKPNFRETKTEVQCCYMDNRLGVFNALKVAETLENGIICFSCWEESGGGSVENLAKFIHEKYNVTQALISDITWVTEGVPAGKGVAVSIRDSGIPRQSYIRSIIEHAKKSKIPFQLEVEATGGSDGIIIHHSPYPIDWCFIGAPELEVHSPNEKVNKFDIECMIDLYKYLMKKM